MEQTKINAAESALLAALASGASLPALSALLYPQYRRELRTTIESNMVRMEVDLVGHRRYKRRFKPRFPPPLICTSAIRDALNALISGFTVERVESCHSYIVIYIKEEKT